jgi:hypothetical protein
LLVAASQPGPWLAAALLYDPQPYWRLLRLNFGSLY